MGVQVRLPPGEPCREGECPPRAGAPVAWMAKRPDGRSPGTSGEEERDAMTLNWVVHAVVHSFIRSASRPAGQPKLFRTYDAEGSAGSRTDVSGSGSRGPTASPALSACRAPSGWRGEALGSRRRLRLAGGVLGRQRAEGGPGDPRRGREAGSGGRRPASVRLKTPAGRAADRARQPEAGGSGAGARARACGWDSSPAPCPPPAGTRPGSPQPQTARGREGGGEGRGGRAGAPWQ